MAQALVLCDKHRATMLDPNADDAEAPILLRARAGDRQALEALIERYQAQVYRFGKSLCRHEEDANDVLQDTLLAMARGIREFRGASSLSTWLYAIARSHCIKKRRKPEPSELGSRDRSADDLDALSPLVDPKRPPDEALAEKQLERAIERAIRGLEPAYREVLVLRDVEGLSAAEVGEVLGLTVQAVKSRLHRARRAVRYEVAPLLEIPMIDEPESATGACPDVLTMFSQHLEDEISSDRCAEMERHLEGCAKCRGACASLKRSLALCRTSGRSVEVPDAIQASVKVALRNFLREKV